MSGWHVQQQPAQRPLYFDEWWSHHLKVWLGSTFPLMNCLNMKVCWGQIIMMTADPESSSFSSWINPPIYLHLIFEISSSRNWFFNLIFFSISNLILTACAACKNRVWNRQKIKFKSQFRELEISKIMCRSTGDQSICLFSGHRSLSWILHSQCNNHSSSGPSR